MESSMQSRKSVEESLRQWLQGHHAVISRSEARRLGASDSLIRSKLDRGDWVRIHQGIYRLAAAPTSHHQDLRAACLIANGRAVVSHASAAWLWGLQRDPPARPEVTVAAGFQHGQRDRWVTVHRSKDLDWSRIVIRRTIPVTNPLRTLVDLGASVATDTLATAVDVGLATRLVTVEGLVAELSRVGRRGRPGPGALRLLLAGRGFVGVPHPSVLEGKTLGLIKAAGLADPEREFNTGPDGEFRLDFAFPIIRFAIEVDGYVWHFTPEHLQRDHARRNQLQRDGWVVLVYTWRDITAEPARVVREIASCYQRLGGVLV
jgi:hypothetical protein